MHEMAGRKCFLHEDKESHRLYLCISSHCLAGHLHRDTCKCTLGNDCLSGVQAGKGIHSLHLSCSHLRTSFSLWVEEFSNIGLLGWTISNKAAKAYLLFETITMSYLAFHFRSGYKGTTGMPYPLLLPGYPVLKMSYPIFML